MKICEIVQQTQFLDETTIKNALNKKCIKQFAYIKHDKDADENGNLKAPHWHIMIQFYDSQDSKYIAKWFEIEEQYVGKSTSGRFNSMLCYLTHANAPGKHQYASSEVTANFDFVKFMEQLNTQQQLEDIIRLIENGTIREFNYTNYISPEMYIKNKDKIKSAFEYRRDKVYNGNRNLEVIFIQGAPGAGKTTYAKHLAKQLNYSFFVSASDNDLLDGYKGQDCIILDDLRGGSIKLTDLLKLLDNNTDSSTRSRFHNKVLTECKLIIITTVVNMDSFYKSVFNSSNEPVSQFKRRISTLIIMDKDFIRVGQYDKTTQSYQFENTVFENPLKEILKESTVRQTRTSDELQKFLSLKPASSNNDIKAPF